MFRRRDNIGFREDKVHTSLYSPYHTIPVYTLKNNDIVSGEGLFFYVFVSQFQSRLTIDLAYRFVF